MTLDKKLDRGNGRTYKDKLDEVNLSVTAIEGKEGCRNGQMFSGMR